jgi:hypothetical protein
MTARVESGQNEGAKGRGGEWGITTAETLVNPT